MSSNLFSREGLLLLNNVFLVAAAATVLVGTLYPLILDAMQLGKISVGPPYFNSVFLPLMAPLMLLVGFAMAVSWKQADWKLAARRLRIPALVALVAIALPWLLERRAAMLACVGSALAIWIIGATLAEPLRRIRSGVGMPRAVVGMTLAHLGLGLWTLGVAFVSSFSDERDVRLAPGGATELGGYEFALQGVERHDGPNYAADRGSVTVSRHDSKVADLAPEKRLYPSQGNVMTEAAVDYNLRRDLYVSLGEAVGDKGEWTLRLYYKPLIRLVWLGGVFMFVGGLLAATDRRYRLASARQALPAGAATASK